MGRHVKRVASPKSWPIAKKTHVWVVGAYPGPHSKERGIPLLLVVRDLLKLANNAREAKRIINEGNILVDGVVRRDYKYMVGLFDILSVPLIKENYRVLLDVGGRLRLNKVEESDLKKLCRVNNKVVLKGGAVQLNLHDGTNMLGSHDYKTFDSILLSIPDKEITKHIRYVPGNLAMIVGGEHSGEIGKIKEIRKIRGSGANMVVISDNRDIETIEDYIFVIGEDKPEIKTGEAL